MAVEPLELSRKRVLLTGGNGFIGSSVLSALGSMGVSDVIAPARADCDLTHEPEVERLFKEVRPQIVFHLAGLNGGILANQKRPAEFYYQNLMMGTLLIHHAWRAGVERCVVAGAGCGYPSTAPNPLREDDLWNGSPQPESAPYALAKRMLSVQSEAYFRQYGFVCVVAVLGSVYGPHDNFALENAPFMAALVRKFCDAAASRTPAVEVWGTGNATRDCVFVDDVVDALIRCATRSESASTVNVSSGESTSIRNISEILRRLTGYGGAVRWIADRPEGQQHRRLDVTRAFRALGWSASTSLDDGLRKTIDWYVANYPRTEEK